MGWRGGLEGVAGRQVEDDGNFGGVMRRQGGTLFMKMTGPREVLEAERPRFFAFMDSLGVNRGAAAVDTPQAAPPGPRTAPILWGNPDGWS